MTATLPGTTTFMGRVGAIASTKNVGGLCRIDGSTAAALALIGGAGLYIVCRGLTQRKNSHTVSNEPKLTT